MTEPNGPRDMGRPIRVVLLRGPFQPPSARRFFALLDEHPEVDLIAGLCEAPGEGLAARLRDIWRRRGPLALPILTVQTARRARWFVSSPREVLDLRRRMAAIDRRTEFVPDVHAPAVLDRLRRLEPDLGVVYGGPILREELFSIPRLGTLSIHHGWLPDYRGKKTTFWELYDGRETAGITIQRINAGLDTGEIAARGKVPAGSKSYGRVWREVQDLGVSLYLETILQIKRGTASFRPQSGPRGRLCRDPTWLPMLRLGWRRMRKRWSRR